jgi:long-chain acyl-CoA synthetase
MIGVVISGDRTLKQSDLQARAAKAAAAFDSIGIGEDGGVAIMLRNDFGFFEAASAAALVGAYAVPLNWHYKADEAGYIIKDCGAKVLVVHADLLPQIADGVPDDVEVCVIPTPPEIQFAYGLSAEECAAPAGAVQWSDWIDSFDPWRNEPPALRSNMIYTSGTTGRPKGVRRAPVSPQQATDMTQAVGGIFDMWPEKPVRTVVTGPVYHSAPNFYALTAVQYGGYVILQPRFDAEELLALIQDQKITHLHMVPTMFVRLLKLPTDVKEKYDLSSLKHVVHAAAPCPPDVKRQMIEWFGPVIMEYYGGTETGGTVFHNSGEALAKPGTVGKPLPGCEIKILNDDGEVLPAGEIGEVYMRNSAWPDFTYNGLDQKRKDVERLGLISCGDVGYLDEDGFLFLCDRIRDMVISGGVNIYPAEIEAVLIGMPGIHDCAVFGIPDDEFGESLCAYVELESGANLTDADIRAWLRPRQANYKMPKLIKFQDGLPREDSGKIFKRKLREPYWEEAGRQI